MLGLLVPLMLTAAPPPTDRPLGNKVVFQFFDESAGAERIYQTTIRGELGGQGFLEVDPNLFRRGSDGKITGGETKLGWARMPVTLQATNHADLQGKNRKAYEVIRKDAKAGGKTYRLSVAKTEEGPHHAQICDAGKELGTYEMIDPEREEFKRQLEFIAKLPNEEQAALEKIRNVVGYSFRFRGEGREPNVTFLYFHSGVADIVALDTALASLPKLNYLAIYGGILHAPGLESLAKLPALKSLGFSRCKVHDAGLACLKHATSVEHLYLDHASGLTDAGLAHLTSLANLTLLDLRDEGFMVGGADKTRKTGISDAGLAHLSGCKKMKHLYLMGHQFTDDGLKHLAGITSLETLSLSHDGVTDRGLTHLEGLTKLSQLHLYYTKVTPEGRKALKAKLPRLRD